MQENCKCDKIMKICEDLQNIFVYIHNGVIIIYQHSDSKIVFFFINQIFVNGSFNFFSKLIL